MKYQWHAKIDTNNDQSITFNRKTLTFNRKTLYF